MPKSLRVWRFQNTVPDHWFCELFSDKKVGIAREIPSYHLYDMGENIKGETRFSRLQLYKMQIQLLFIQRRQSKYVHIIFSFKIDKFFRCLSPKNIQITFPPAKSILRNHICMHVIYFIEFKEKLIEMRHKQFWSTQSFTLYHKIRCIWSASSRTCIDFKVHLYF